MPLMMFELTVSNKCISSIRDFQSEEIYFQNVELTLNLFRLIDQREQIHGVAVPILFLEHWMALY